MTATSPGGAAVDRAPAGRRVLAVLRSAGRGTYRQGGHR
ncbi:hypothetical protein JOF36_000582 [Pseudonocardia parietis]|jgi:hypothetical protein|uniref:Uncharacterized protein n=1 Tax=Pseudonocardia parietis TaxID=570936 RepID=A0ABS4VM82_9PSEU|nr:hypothetical protein [Pseudonocardia parietis]